MYICVSVTYSNVIIALLEHTTTCKTKHVISSVYSENVYLMLAKKLT